MSDLTKNESRCSFWKILSCCNSTSAVDSDRQALTERVSPLSESDRPLLDVGPSSENILSDDLDRTLHGNITQSALIPETQLSVVSPVKRKNSLSMPTSPSLDDQDAPDSSLPILERTTTVQTLGRLKNRRDISLGSTIAVETDTKIPSKPQISTIWSKDLPTSQPPMVDKNHLPKQSERCKQETTIMWEQQAKKILNPKEHKQYIKYENSKFKKLTDTEKKTYRKLIDKIYHESWKAAQEGGNFNFGRHSDFRQEPSLPDVPQHKGTIFQILRK